MLRVRELPDRRGARRRSPRGRGTGRGRHPLDLAWGSRVGQNGVKAAAGVLYAVAVDGAGGSDGAGWLRRPRPSRAAPW